MACLQKKIVYTHIEGFCYDFPMHSNLIHSLHLLAHPITAALLWEMLRHSSVKELRKVADCGFVDM
jgi:hypothetical protein